MKRLVLVLFLPFIIGCVPEPRYRGFIYLMNCTNDQIVVHSSIDCPNKVYSSELTISSGELTEIASTDYVADRTEITIDSFLINYDNAKVEVSIIINSIELTKEWKYNYRDTGGRQLFNLNDCYYESGEDPRVNYTYINYIFMIKEEDFTESSDI